MATGEIKKLIKAVGMGFFIRYYYELKENDNQTTFTRIMEDYTKKSKRSRISKSHKIFKDNLNFDVLNLIIESKRVPDSTRKEAEKFYTQKKRESRYRRT